MSYLYLFTLLFKLCLDPYFGIEGAKLGNPQYSTMELHSSCALLLTWFLCFLALC